MKRIIMVFLFASMMSLPCLGRGRHIMTGLDLTAFLKGSAGAGVCYGASPHWSVAGEISFTYKRIARTITSVQEEHESELTDTSLTTDTVLQSSRIMMSYWPLELMRGPYVSLGLQTGNSTDIISEAGYMIPIWKGLCMSMGVRIPVIHSIIEEKLGAQNLRIGIHYKF